MLRNPKFYIKLELYKINTPAFFLEHKKKKITFLSKLIRYLKNLK